MTSIADSSVKIQTTSESNPSPPGWFGEVVLMSRYLQKHGILSKIKDLDLASVRDWDRRANERLLTALAELPEPRLLEPDWWTFGRALGSVFDVDHDREHAQDIQRWVGQS